MSGFNANAPAITAAIPSPFTFTLDNGITGTNISDGGSDMYDGGNYLNTNLASAIAYSGGVVTPSAAFGTTGQYFTQKLNNMFVMAADLDNVTTFSITGNNGADGSGVADGFTYSVTVGCQSYDVFVKRVHSAFDPSVNQIFIVPSGSGATHTFSTNTDNTLHTLTGLNTATRLYYLLVAGSGGYAYTNAEIQAIVVDFLTQTNAAVASPLVVTQIAGPASGSSFPVGTTPVTFEATGASGTSTCTFNVVVNDIAPVITPSVTSFCPGGSSTLTASGGTSYLWNTGDVTASIAVLPAVSTTYSVTVTDTYGCTGTASQLITVNTLSTAPTIAPVAGSYCPNTDVILSAAGGTAGSGSSIEWYSGPSGTGTWLGTGSSLTLTTSVTMNVYARREGPCNSTVDDVVNIVVKEYIYALNGATSNTYCTDNAGWHHFYIGDEVIWSCQGDFSGAPAGYPVVTIADNGVYYQETQGPATPADCSIGLDPGEERFEMERSWNLDFGGGTTSGVYGVRFYYEPIERTTIESAAAAWMATYPACSYTYKYATPLGFYWFKNTGSNYTAPDYDGLHLNGPLGTTVNSINYIELTGVTSFSGGSGAVILEPLAILPVTLGSYNATCSNDSKEVNVEWTTLSEMNTSHFVIERNTDGLEWTVIGEVQAAGSSNSIVYYNFTDSDTRQNQEVYYRVKQYDLDGGSDDFGVVSAECLSDETGFSINPNPAEAMVAIELYGDFSNENTHFSFTDLNGKLIKRIDYHASNGKVLNVDLDELAPGCYLIRMVTDDQTVQMERLIKK